MAHSPDTLSETAQAFGAKVDLKRDGQALCLVVGRVSPIAAINAVQGSIAVALSRTKVLAVIELASLAAVQRHPDVVRAGAVSVDQERFAAFVRMMGVNN